MKVFIAIASSEQQHVGSIQSCYMLTRRDSDKIAASWLYRGDVARESMVEAFMRDDDFGDEDAILLLDADQRHPADMLEKLRAHDLDMVCAHYYRRETNPVQSLCFELGDGTWPYLPYRHPPREGLHEIATTGFGCVLIKKKVIRAVEDTLPPGASPVAIAPMPEVFGDHANVGPDFRFFMMARKAGYRLWLDASIESLHAVVIWLGHKSADLLDDPIKWADAAHQIMELRLERERIDMSMLEAYRQRKRILEARIEGLKEQAMAMVNAKTQGIHVDGEKQAILSIAIYEMQGKIKEMDAWIEWAEKYPAIERPDQLPTTENTPAQDMGGEASYAVRQEAHKQNAQDLIDALPEVERG